MSALWMSGILLLAIGAFTTFQNGEHSVLDVWWFTLLPLFLGSLFIMAAVALEMLSDLKAGIRKIRQSNKERSY